jgi:ubiquinone/menaquinone biosynthesis C-methylase UbiE
VEFIQDSVEHIPLPDASVDAAVASVTAHHWTDQGVGFAELFRVIRPGGRLVLAEFKSSGPLLRRLAGSKHANAPSLEDWRARLERAGFDEVGTGRGGWVRGFALFIVAVR